MSGNNYNVDPPQPPSLETALIYPAAADKADVCNSNHRGWTMELNFALLEEIGNCGAHTPGYNQSMKCWEAVTAAFKLHCVPYDNPRTIQCQWDKLILKMSAALAMTGKYPSSQEEVVKGMEIPQ